MTPTGYILAAVRETTISGPKEKEIPPEFWILVLFVIAVFSFLAWIQEESNRFESRKGRAKVPDREIPWEELFTTAESAINEVIAELPPEVKKITGEVPFVLQKWCPTGTSLGRYLGMTSGKISDANGPIFIYVGSHYRFCEEQMLDFETEVRRTYLHELCHHFGLSETEVEERGLA